MICERQTERQRSFCNFFCHLSFLINSISLDLIRSSKLILGWNMLRQVWLWASGTAYDHGLYRLQIAAPTMGSGLHVRALWAPDTGYDYGLYGL